MSLEHASEGRRGCVVGLFGWLVVLAGRLTDACDVVQRDRNSLHRFGVGVVRCRAVGARYPAGGRDRSGTGNRSRSGRQACVVTSDAAHDGEHATAGGVRAASWRWQWSSGAATSAGPRPSSIALAERLRRLGANATIVFVEQPGPLGQRLASAGLPYRSVGLGRGRDIVRHPRRYAREVASVGGDGALLLEMRFHRSRSACGRLSRSDRGNRTWCPARTARSLEVQAAALAPRPCERRVGRRRRGCCV